MIDTTRRSFLCAAGAAALTATAPGLAFARAPGDARLVLVILRGALDGLALVPPYADPHYRALRGALAFDKPGNSGGVLALDRLFGLHPAMPEVHRLFGAGQVKAFHAIASPYRSRSHFDGQDVLENGATSAGQRRDGWLNRALAGLPPAGSSPAIALAHTTPLVLRGDAAVTSFAPSRLPGPAEDTIERLRELYANDEFFRTRLEQAIDAQDMAGDMSAARRQSANDAVDTLTRAGRFLTEPDGPRIAVAQFDGWDTHANQGRETGPLARRLGALDSGLAALAKTLGDAWDQTLVLVVTEFGRTVRVNGTRGTDHGTAGAALALGGAVNGGFVQARWPGLGENELFDGRDLAPTADLRSLFKTALAHHMGLSAAFVDRHVFEDAQPLPAWPDLLREA